ncbi:MAG: fibronectin type III-like domain-contianing protein [Bacteroidales bacterium]
MKDRTYKYFTGEVLYPFGFGLGYSQFDYSNLKLQQFDNKIEVTIDVNNNGEFSGEEVIQVYAKKTDSKVAQPLKRLVGFKRVSLKKGVSEIVEIRIDTQWLKYWDVEKQQYLIEPGEYEIQVGSSSEDNRVKQILNLK